MLLCNNIAGAGLGEFSGEYKHCEMVKFGDPK